jgi:hypothetical protein
MQTRLISEHIQTFIPNPLLTDTLLHWVYTIDQIYGKNACIGATTKLGFLPPFLYKATLPSETNFQHKWQARITKAIKKDLPITSSFSHTPRYFSDLSITLCYQLIKYKAEKTAD